MTEGQALVEAQRELWEMEARAEKAEAALVAAEQWRAEDLKFADQRQVNAVKLARAVMAEEAQRELLADAGIHSDAFAFSCARRVADKFSALAPLPAGLVVLPVDVPRGARGVLKHVLDAVDEGEDIDLDQVRSSIAALDASGGATK